MLRGAACLARGLVAVADRLSGGRLRVGVCVLAAAGLVLFGAGSVPLGGGVGGVSGALASGGDSDGDGVPDATDDCVLIVNPDQRINPCLQDGSWGAALIYGGAGSEL